MKKTLTLLIGVLTVLTALFYSHQAFSESHLKRKVIVAFYNLDNLFDTEDDPQTRDDAFLPEGQYQWTQEKYEQKLNNIAGIIANTGDKHGPDILGLAEVENLKVLEDLVQTDALAARGYEIVHSDSRDRRGIDVAMIYDPGVFTFKAMRSYEVLVRNEPEFRTQPIMVVQGSLRDHEIFFAINHWPSRRGAPEQTAHRRAAAAETLRQISDSLRYVAHTPHLILLGDFNDNPGDETMLEILEATLQKSASVDSAFYNPIGALYDPRRVGSSISRDQWQLYDQILLSPAFLDEHSPIRYAPGTASIYQPYAVQARDIEAAPMRPIRSIYRGEFQPDGASDHFPVFLTLWVD